MNDIRDDLKAFLDGELSPERAADVQAALDTNPELRQEAETMKLLGFEIKKLAAEPMVSGRAETMAALRGPEKRRWNPRFALNALAAVFLVGVVGAVLFPLFAPAKEAAKRSMEMADAASPASERASLQEGPTAGSTTQQLRGDSADVAYKSSVPADMNRRTGGAPSTSPSTNATIAPQISNRMVVKNGSLGVRVASANDAMGTATTITAGLGGFVTSSTRTGSESTQATGSMTLRIPSKQFETAVARMSSLGEVVDGPNLSGDDVTAQYADMTARIKVLRAEEDSLITMLRAARRVSEMLEIKERITGVRAEIDSLSAQAKALGELSALSTLTVTFEEKPKIGKAEVPADPFGEAWINAVNGLRAAGTFLGQIGINLFVYSPIWLPIAIILGLWLRRVWRVQ